MITFEDTASKLKSYTYVTIAFKLHNLFLPTIRTADDS